MYFDANGLIVQRDGDGGDTAAREGAYFVARYLVMFEHYEWNEKWKRKLNSHQVLELLQVEPGVFVRNPVHYNDPKDFSRDQTTPLIVALGFSNNTSLLKKLFWKQVKNYGRFQNGDWSSPADLGNYIRAFRSYLLYPVLLVGDLFLLGETIIRCIRGSDHDTSDDINHTIMLLQAQHVMPTPISWLARKIYVKFRPGGVQHAWDEYFKPSSNANPFNEIYRPFIGKM